MADEEIGQGKSGGGAKAVFEPPDQFLNRLVVVRSRRRQQISAFRVARFFAAWKASGANRTVKSVADLDIFKTNAADDVKPVSFVIKMPPAIQADGGEQDIKKQRFRFR